jgi:Zn-dependent protease
LAARPPGRSLAALITWLLGASILPGGLRHQPPALYWTAAAAGAVLFLASLLAHELSHAVVAKRHGVEVRSITLWMLGGVAELEGEPPDAGADLRIALAGPAASVAAAAVFLGAAAAARYAGGPALVAATAGWLAAMNGLLAVFNLLPGAPLDGGRVLRALLWRHYHDRRRAEAAAARAGQFLGAGIAAVGVAEVLAWASLGGIWLMLIGWFLMSAAAAEKNAATAAAALGGMRVADIMTASPELAPGWNTVADFIDRVAARSRQDAFPVVDFGGRLTGLVLSDALAGIPHEDRARLRLDQVALSVPARYQAAPGDPAGPPAGSSPSSCGSSPATCWRGARCTSGGSPGRTAP